MTPFKVHGGSWLPCQWKKNFLLSLFGGRVRGIHHDEVFFLIIESSHSKLNSCRIHTGRPPLLAGVPREQEYERTQQGLFIVSWRRFGPRPGKSWDDQTAAHISSPPAFLPSLCPQRTMSQMVRQHEAVGRGRPVESSRPGVCPSSSLASYPETGTTPSPPSSLLAWTAQQCRGARCVRVHVCTCVC